MSIETTIFNKAKAYQRLIRCIVELSPLCNLSCEMCGISLKSDELSKYGRILQYEEWQILVDQLYDCGVLTLVFSGGEPLLYPDFGKLYEYAYKKGFLIEIRTNGLLIHKYQDLFRKMPPRQIAISVYGDSDDMYYRMTGAHKGFSQLMEALEITRTIKCRLHLTCTMTKTNVSEFFNIAKLADVYKASLGMITDIFPHIKGEKSNIQSRLSAAECAALAFYPPKEYQKALDIAQELEMNYAEKFSLDSCINGNSMEMCNSCQIGACIKWDGRMTFCPEIETVFSKPLSVGIGNAWKQILEARSECAVSNNQCISCGIRAYCTGACPARFYLETGDYRKPCRCICEKAFYTKILSKEKGYKK